MIKKRLAFGQTEIQIMIKKTTSIESGPSLMEKIGRLKKQLTDKRFRSHPISRFLRPVFETRGLRAFLGLKLAIIIAVAAFSLPTYQVFGYNQEEELTVLRTKLTKMATEISVRLPLGTREISQGYHAFHRAIDFNGQTGDSVYPIMNGIVESIGYSRFSYGNHIIINHGSGINSLYAHLSQINVSEGQVIDKNTIIGLVGSTGFSTGSHLHLEVSDHGRNLNPLSILPY